MKKYFYKKKIVRYKVTLKSMSSTILKCAQKKKNAPKCQ